MDKTNELNDEEERILQKHKKLEQESKSKDESFWADEYSKYSIEDKIDYWLANIHHGMRIQGESNGDPYCEFSEVWYKNVKSREPNFDWIFGKVIQQISI